MRHATLLHSFLNSLVSPASSKGSSVQSPGGSFLDLPKCRIALQAKEDPCLFVSFVSFPLISLLPFPSQSPSIFKSQACAQGYTICTYPPAGAILSIPPKHPLSLLARSPARLLLEIGLGRFVLYKYLFVTEPEA